MHHLDDFLTVSGFAQLCRSRWPQAFTVLRENNCLAHADASTIDECLAQDPLEDAMVALRRRRQLHCLRIAWRNLTGRGDFIQTSNELSALADDCQQQALDEAHHRMRSKFGHLPDCRLAVIALGKLGGYELNFSSDIDVLFVYEGRGKSDGARKLEESEYFTRLAREWITLLDRVTEHGHVYRVDTRLRPFGKSGALCWSLRALEEYYQNEGRDWERFALLRARPAAGDQALGRLFVERIRPFVFRRYLDYGLFEGVRAIRAEVEREGQRRGRRHHLKLGPGGIREVEFLVQSHQVLRGGQEAALRCTNTLQALHACQRLGLIATDEARQLHQAYVALRNAENHLQMLDDQQTHELPRQPEQQQRLARLTGCDWDGFVQSLHQQQANVRRQFGRLFQEPPATDARWHHLSAGDMDADEAIAELEQLGFQGARAWQLLEAHRQRVQRMPLSAEARKRIQQFRPRLLAVITRVNADAALLDRCLDLLVAVARRSAYLALLLENPQALERMVTLFARSRAVAEWVSAQPGLLDDLIDPVLSRQLPGSEEINAQLQRRLLLQDDDDRRQEALARALQSFRLNIAISELTGQVPAAAAQHALTTLARALCAQVLALQDLPQPVPDCGFAIIGYGAVGAGEMRYGSDLDLVFLYQPARLSEQQATRLARRIIHWLSTPGTAGRLYPIDTRLRPNGRSGLLVSSLTAFTSYQRHNAWTWEIQALARAHAIAGDQTIRRTFENIRHEVLSRPRDAGLLRHDLTEMREKMRATLNARDVIKHGPGGLVDIQFLCQYWQLLYAHREPGLITATATADLLAQLITIAGPHQAYCTTLLGIWPALVNARHRQELTGSHALSPGDKGRDDDGGQPDELHHLLDQAAAIYGAVLGRASR